MFEVHVARLAVEVRYELKVAVDEIGNFLSVPVKQDVQLVPSVGLVRLINELGCVDFKSFLVAHSVENGRAESTFLFITLFKWQLKFADIFIIRNCAAKKPFLRHCHLRLLIQSQITALRV